MTTHVPTAAQRCATLHETVLTWAEVDPTRVFCYFRRDGGEQALTYGALASGARRFAALYQAHGLQPDETVSIVLGHGPAQAQAFVGAQLGGFVPSFLAPPNPRQDAGHYWQQLRAQCQRLTSGVLVTTAELAQGPMADVVRGSALRLLVGDDHALPDPQPGFRVVPNDIALLQHSSGTTGARKGVALSHRAVLQQLDLYGASLGLGPQDVIVSWLPLYHDMGLISSFLLPMVTGTPLVLLDPFEWVSAPATLLDAVAAHRATLCWLPNFAFHFLARMPLPTGPRADLSSLRAVINCSEPCKAEAFELFGQRFAPSGIQAQALQICYAMAETVFAVTQTAPGILVQPLSASRQALAQGRLAAPADDADTTRLMPVGKPLPGVSVRVCDEHGQTRAEGEVGELVIEAPFLFSGYHLEPALSAAALQFGGYRSGDLGAWYQGQLYITGRLKDLVIVNGKNYYLHDIEAAIHGVQGIKSGRCVAFGLYQAATGSEAVHAVAEAADDGIDPLELARAVKAAVQAQLGLALARVRVVPGKWLVKTTSGKIARGENRDKYVADESARRNPSENLR
jgi:fatty-acyl-CoA synthase